MAQRALFTIGYEGTDIGRFVETLVVVGVQVVVDVRAVTVSRKPGFSKKGLQARLEGEGIRYLHLVELGDPKPGREAARAGRMVEFERIYRGHLASPGPQAALGELAKAVDDEVCCLMCFERSPRVCHRSMVAAAIRGESGVFDLYGDDPERYRLHAAKLPRRGPRESTPPAE